ncbi:MAG: bifunctional DNA-formamidopyrimidine glycosylase/DNA-(apurinic or apyrimidinic site) lyase [Alphaproteobacteria bacterium]|nr:MAG: bifunctional DNA-formamidopyrimidine glycosylase/DNA-(apurinic or apyrimidinic site) lyase [Alphaproteobacteria bacterium]
MPELPEVETVRTGLEQSLVGRRFDRVEARRPDLRFPIPTDLATRLQGHRVLRVNRRAKYLQIIIDDNSADRTVVILHLGMSGRVNLMPAPDAGPHADLLKHDHLVFDLDDGARMVFNDPRRFGFIALSRESALDDHDYFKDMGPEPLGNAFNAEILSQALKDKDTPIKAALLDQRVVAGLGNIYVCEALYDAGISPKRKARTVAGLRADRLVPAIKDVLQRAIAAGGSTLRDFAQLDGQSGYFQHSFRVYGREGEACLSPGCDKVVKRITQSGRSTFYCSSCQR